MVVDYELSEDESEEDSDESVKVPIFVLFDPRINEDEKPVRMMVDLTMTVWQLKKEIEAAHDLPAEESVMISGDDCVMEDIQTLKFYRVAHSSTMQHTSAQVRSKYRGEEDNASSPENIRTFDFRGGELTPGVKVWRVNQGKPTVASEEPIEEGENKETEPVWQKEKDGSSSLVLNADCYLTCPLDLPPNHGKLINDYTIQVDMCLPALSALSLYENSWPEPKETVAVSVNEEGVFGVLGDFTGEEAHKQIGRAHV